LQGRKIVVQGLGAVGQPMVEYLVKENADVTVADIDENRVAQLQNDFGVAAMDVSEVFGANADIYCPCALGGIVNDETLPQFRVKIICGSANNQLRGEAHGDELMRRGILYAPDYIANAGGTVFDTDRLWGGVNAQRGMNKVAKIYERMKQVIDISKTQNIPTYLAADRLAEERIAQARAIKRIGGYNQGIPPTM
jgi:leucine dehydrogenase